MIPIKKEIAIIIPEILQVFPSLSSATLSFNDHGPPLSVTSEEQTHIYRAALIANGSSTHELRAP